MKLGELVSIVGGGTPSRGKKEYWDGSIPWISVKDFNSDKISSSLEKITEQGLRNSASRIIPEGSVIVPTRMALGKVAITEIDVAINQDLKAILITNHEKLDTEYLFYFMKFSGKQLESLGKGATVKGVSVQALTDLEIPLPSLQVQREIVRTLSIADSLVQSRKLAIAKLVEMVLSVFLDMFGEPINNTRKWDVASLEQIAVVKGGLQVTSKRNSNPLEVPYLRVANVFMNKLDLSEIKTIRVTQPELDRCTISKGDILLVEGHGNINEIGRSTVWDGSIESCVHQNHLIRVVPNVEKVNSYFLSYLLNLCRSQFLSVGKTTSGLNTISTNNVRQLKVMLPPVKEQDAFVRHWEEVRGISRTMQAQLAKLEHNFQALLHQAFTGQLQFATERETIAVQR